MSDSQLLTFLISSFALLLIPGPAVVFVVARAARYGPRAGLVATLGLSAGAAFHVLASAVGLSALLASSALSFHAVKILGAGYLLWLGVKSLVSEPASSPLDSANSPLARNHLIDGFVVNILNPKAALFFLAFLPQFITHAGPPAHVQIVILGFIFVCLALITDGTYALAAGSARRLFLAAPGTRRFGRYLSATTYFGLAISAALTGRRAD